MTTNRTLASGLNDRAVEAIRAGDNRSAQDLWLEAAHTDPTYSGPAFNIARFILTTGTEDPSELAIVTRYLDAAERNARGTDAVDTHIREQLPSLREVVRQRMSGDALVPQATVSQCKVCNIVWVRIPPPCPACGSRGLIQRNQQPDDKPLTPDVKKPWWKPW